MKKILFVSFLVLLMVLVSGCVGETGEIVWLPTFGSEETPVEESTEPEVEEVETPAEPQKVEMEKNFYLAIDAFVEAAEDLKDLEFEVELSQDSLDALNRAPVVVDTPEVEAPEAEAETPAVEAEVEETDPLFTLPEWVGSQHEWLNELTSEQRKDIVGKELAKAIEGLDELAVQEIEEGWGFTFNADGIAKTDFPWILGLLYHIHLSGNDIAYLFGQDYEDLEAFLGDGETLSGDITFRFAGFLKEEVGADGTFCKPFWNAYKFDRENGKRTLPFGYFAENCGDVPELYEAAPVLVPIFELLYNTTGADLVMIGTRPGVWHFYSNLAVQDSSHCPEGWRCLVTNEDVSNEDPTYRWQTNGAEDLYAAFYFSPDLTDAEIQSFIQEYQLTVEEE